VLNITRVLVKAARKIASQYHLIYQDEIPPSQLVQRIAGVMQEYTQSGWVNSPHYLIVPCYSVYLTIFNQ